MNAPAVGMSFAIVADPPLIARASVVLQATVFGTAVNVATQTIGTALTAPIVAMKFAAAAWKVILWAALAMLRGMVFWAKIHMAGCQLKFNLNMRKSIPWTVDRMNCPSHFCPCH